MTDRAAPIDFDRLFKLRLLVARFGEMDAARWWNTGDQARRTALMGRSGALLLSRGFPRTHQFAQARIVMEVARARCDEVFDPPGSVTLWKLPAQVEDQFDARWAGWLEDREELHDYFAKLEAPPTDLLAAMSDFGLADATELAAVKALRRSAEGRAVPVPGVPDLNDALVTILAAAFSLGEPGKLAVPYARMDT